MDFKGETRCIFLGGSESGKTFNFRRMLLSSMFGDYFYDEYCIISASDKITSIEQNVWHDLETRGYLIKTLKMDKTGNYPMFKQILNDIHKQSGEYKNVKKTIMCIDDVDSLSRLDARWVADLFGVESHHSKLSLVCILHHFSCGAPSLFNSATHVFLFGIQDNYALKVCDKFDINYEKYLSVFTNKNNAIKCDEYYKNFNFIVKYLGTMTDEYGYRVPTHYTIDFDNGKLICI